jgi:protein tyrosine phosphatase (PTP) superfamily phosphohydrolase (DUF442 family)
MKQLPILACLDAGLLVACGSGTDSDNGTGEGGLAHVDRFAWVSDRIARGAQPKSAAAFRELAAAGIRTVISVDGARPDLAAAREHGLRYVHIPFGYDGVSREDQLALVKTVRELEGPFFIHCHHGKHRGPAGAVLAQMAIGGMTPEQAVAELERAGTSHDYAGLYACARDFAVPEEAETQALEYAFPATAPVPALAEAMASIDRRWDAMKLVEAAGYRPPEGHPDISPAHEALQLRELLTELARTEDHRSRPEDYRRWMEESRDAAGRLEDALREDPVAEAAAEAAYSTIRSNCASCHRQYRNRAE